MDVSMKEKVALANLSNMLNFEVLQFKYPSYNALNSHNVEYLKGIFLGSDTSSEGILFGPHQASHFVLF